jgi:hypothetical protein
MSYPTIKCDNIFKNSTTTNKSINRILVCEKNYTFHTFGCTNTGSQLAFKDCQGVKEMETMSAY